MKRRAFLAGAAGAAGALALPRGAAAQAASANATLDPLLWVITMGEVVRPGRVRLELPPLADNGNAVPMKVTVDSPMSARDHVKAIHLFPQRNMAVFYLGPRAGRAEVVSRVRLAGSQRVMALAEMSDGSFWSGSADVEVTVSACSEGN